MRHYYRRLFSEVIDNVSGVLQEQFLDFKDFVFLDLVHPHCFINWKNGVPAEKLELLEKIYGPLLNFLSLNSNFCLFIEILIFIKQVLKSY